MKKLMAFLLVLILALNAIVFWQAQSRREAEEQQPCAATKIQWPDSGTAMIPVLMKF